MRSSTGQAAVIRVNSLRKTYGGRLSLLETAGEAMKSQEWTP